MNVDLDSLLSQLETRPLGDQVSELWKNDPHGTPNYIRGVVLTYAEFDRLRNPLAAMPNQPTPTASAEWPPTFHYDPALAETKISFARFDDSYASGGAKKNAPPKWWDEGGWD